MNFWDASAIVPLVVSEPSSDRMRDVLEEVPSIVAWWGSPVECASAIARRERDGTLSAAEATVAFDRLRHLAEEWHEVLPSGPVRRLAQRLLRVHPLRSADSLQLAAAIVAADREPSTLTFISLDDHLIEAAGREGFQIKTG